MKQIEDEDDDQKIERWCVVTNGGCSPIALAIAASAQQQQQQGESSMIIQPVTNVVLSSVPRLQPTILTRNAMHLLV